MRLLVAPDWGLATPGELVAADRDRDGFTGLSSGRLAATALVTASRLSEPDLLLVADAWLGCGASSGEIQRFARSLQTYGRVAEVGVVVRLEGGWLVNRGR